MRSKITYLYTEYRGVHRIRECASLYMEYKLSVRYDMESPQPDDDLYDTESVQPCISICNPVSVYIVLTELIISGGLENLHSATISLQMLLLPIHMLLTLLSSLAYGTDGRSSSARCLPWATSARHY